MSVFPQWWRERLLAAELVVAIIVSSSFVLWSEVFRGMEFTEQLLRGNRGAIYGTLASIFGSLLGFVITTVSIVIGFSASERLAVVRESRHYETLWKVFMSTIKVLGLATLAALGGLLFDRDNAPSRLVLYVCGFMIIIATLRLARCVWVLENVIELVTKSAKSGSSGGR